ncbi:hypothetical protein [Pseudomonas phage vB_PaeP_TUMS_P10]|nr:hypothetical protein [Pseudomonas phage vB_PaeP_TUMS_P10]
MNDDQLVGAVVTHLHKNMLCSKYAKESCIQSLKALETATAGSYASLNSIDVGIHHWQKACQIMSDYEG